MTQNVLTYVKLTYIVIAQNVMKIFIKCNNIEIILLTQNVITIGARPLLTHTQNKIHSRIKCNALIY